ncbi:MAG TPA: hypothetical protein VGW12_17995, partial [Pyrinomonadaceae bacterium]|nr:hypothetical protein [Pyrinomonadaceae bacterium]
ARPMPGAHRFRAFVRRIFRRIFRRRPEQPAPLCYSSLRQVLADFPSPAYHHHVAGAHPRPAKRTTSYFEVEEMTKLIRAIALSCVLVAALASVAPAQYGGRYRGGGGTTYRRPSSATSSLILRNSIRRAQIRRQRARAIAAKRRQAHRTQQHTHR